MLLGHSHLELTLASSKTHAGKLLSAAHPNLDGASGLHFTSATPLEAAEQADVVFLALAHGEAMRAVKDMLPRLETAQPPLVVDLSGDFRLATKEQYLDAYEHEHEAPELIATFVYGLPELTKSELATARRVSNPGCFATGAALALAPLARAGLLRGTVVVNGVTGASGSGSLAERGDSLPGARREFQGLQGPLAPARARDRPDARAPRARARARFDLVFTAHSAPITRGIHTTATVALEREAAAQGALVLYESSTQARASSACATSRSSSRASRGPTRPRSASPSAGATS